MPKGQYLTDGELEKEGGHMTDDTIYRSVSLSKGQVFLECVCACVCVRTCSCVYVVALFM